MNLRKNASRAYNIHKGKVRALAVLDASAPPPLPSRHRRHGLLLACRPDRHPLLCL